MWVGIGPVAGLELHTGGVPSSKSQRHSVAPLDWIRKSTLPLENGGPLSVSGALPGLVKASAGSGSNSTDGLVAESLPAPLVAVTVAV